MLPIRRIFLLCLFTALLTLLPTGPAESIATSFKNYEITKLIIPNSNVANLLILIILCCSAAFSSKRSAHPSDFLDRTQTEQLKGIAILLVVLGHLWVHVSDKRASIVFSGDAVALFLLLSGYGLTISSQNNSFTFRYFLLQRIKRVMVPYWIATILIIMLDYLIIGRTYVFTDVLMTSVGINMNTATRHIDYVRWYVTFIIMWYLIFYLIMTNINRQKAVILLLATSAILFPVSYYYLGLGYHFFAFPIGCLIGVYYDQLGTLFMKKRRYAPLFVLTCFLYIISYKIFLGDGTISNYVANHIPNILLAFVNEVNSTLISLALIIAVGYFGIKGYTSELLLFCGKCSYPLFLMHGAFLIKYNCIIVNPQVIPLVISFSLFLFSSLLLAYFFRGLIEIIYAKVF